MATDQNNILTILRLHLHPFFPGSLLFFIVLLTITPSIYAGIMQTASVIKERLTNINIKNLESSGLQLVYILTEQIDGQLSVKTENGTEFNINFTE